MELPMGLTYRGGLGYHSVDSMRRPIAILLMTCVAVWALPGADKAVVGSWEGDSKCAVPDSPCHDEHVLYQIAPDKKDPFLLTLDEYELVDGTPDFIGTLSCQYQGKVGALSCTSSSKEKDDWEFHIVGETMAGRLVLDGKTLYRRITLHKSPK